MKKLINPLSALILLTLLVIAIAQSISLSRGREQLAARQAEVNAAAAELKEAQAANQRLEFERAGLLAQLHDLNMPAMQTRPLPPPGGGTAAHSASTTGQSSGSDSDQGKQIKAYLGDEGFALYQEYQETLGERMQLSQFRMQNAGAGNAISDEQVELLLALMKEEKQNVAAATGQPMPGPAQDEANLQAMFSGEPTEKLLQNQELVSQRVYERATSVLSAEQMDSFGRFQTNQLQMMRMGISMAQKMFAPETTDKTPQPGDR